MNKRNILSNIYLADNLIKKKVRNGIGDNKLTPGVVNFLYFLSEHDGAIQKDISDHFREEPASVTSTLKHMERSGLIERRKNDRDSRAKCIYITSKGRSAQERVDDLYSSIQEEGLKGFSKEELDTLHVLVEKLCSNLERIEE